MKDEVQGRIDSVADEWRQQIISAGGDENVAQQAVALAALNGLFDVYKATPTPIADSSEAGTGETMLYLNRTDVRAIAIQMCAVETLRKIDELPIHTARDIAALSAPVGEPTTGMLLAGARSIGASAHTDNHVQRAKECWHAMNAAMNGVMPPKPPGTHPPAPAVGAEDVARIIDPEFFSDFEEMIEDKGAEDEREVRWERWLASERWKVNLVKANAILSLLSGQGGGK